MPTTHYYVPIKVINPHYGEMVQTALQAYPIFTTPNGDLNQTCFSRENLPFVGDVTVVKTRSRLVAETAHEILSGIEGLIILPITESILEE